MSPRLPAIRGERTAEGHIRFTHFTPAPKPEPPPPKKQQFSSIAQPSHSEKIAKLKLKAKSLSQGIPRRPVKKNAKQKKPKWLVPKVLKSQAQIDREEDFRKYGPQEFRDFLHSHSCLGCGYRGPAIEQAHIHTGGKGRKSGYQKTAPLCGSRWMGLRVVGDNYIIGCHWAYDHAKESWPKSRGIDIDVEQDRFWSEYEDHAEGLGITEP